MRKTFYHIALTTVFTGLAFAATDDSDTSQALLRATDKDYLDKIDSGEKLVKNFPEIMNFGLQVGIDKFDVPNQNEAHQTIGRLRGGALTRGCVVLYYLANAIRIHYDEAGVSKIANQFDQTMIDVLDGKMAWPTIRRGQAMGLFGVAYQSFDPCLRSTRNKSRFSSVAAKYSLDSDMQVREAALIVQMALACQGIRMNADYSALQKLDPGNVNWQHFLEQVRNNNFPTQEFIADELTVEKMRVSDDAALLSIVAGAKIAEAIYAVKFLTADWARATRCFKKLLEIASRSPATREIVVALDKPVLKTASQQEKENLDALLVFLDGVDPELLEDVFGRLYVNLPISMQIDAIDCSWIKSHQPGDYSTADLYGVDAVLSRVGKYILRDDVTPNAIAYVLDRVQALDRTQKGILEPLLEKILALQNKLIAKPSQGESEDWQKLRKVVNGAVLTANDQPLPPLRQ